MDDDGRSWEYTDTNGWRWLSHPPSDHGISWQVVQQILWAATLMLGIKATKKAIVEVMATHPVVRAARVKSKKTGKERLLVPQEIGKRLDNHMSRKIPGSKKVQEWQVVPQPSGKGKDYYVHHSMLGADEIHRIRLARTKDIADRQDALDAFEEALGTPTPPPRPGLPPFEPRPPGTMH